MLNMPPVLTSGALRGSERAVMTSSSLPVTPPTTATGVALHQDGVVHATLDDTGDRNTTVWFDDVALAVCLTTSCYFKPFGQSNADGSH